MCPAPSASESGPDDIARLLADGRLAEALARLETRIARREAEPRDSALLASLARAADAAGDLASAERAIEAALVLADWADLHLAHGMLLLRRGRRADARRAFERALTLNPGYRAAAVERALLDAREGRIAEALETLRVLAAEARDAEPGALREGLDRLGHADFDDAAPLLRRALHTSDSWLEALLADVHARLQRGDAAGALQRLREAVDERPGYADLHAMLGAQEMAGGLLDDALESLARALEINPSFHAARVQLAHALEALGETPHALEQLDLVLAAAPDDADALALHERLTSRRRGSRRELRDLPNAS